MNNNYNVSNKVSFNAQLVGCGKILHSKNEILSWKPVDLYKFDVNSIKDTLLLERIKRKWQGKNGIGQILSYIRGKRTKDAEVFGLVKQGRDFDEYNVLGLMATAPFEARQKYVPIYNIATSPKYAYAQHGNDRSLKHIGRELFHAVKYYIKKTTGKKTYIEYAYPEEKEFLNKIHARVFTQG